MKKLILLLAIVAAFVSCKKINGPNPPHDRLKAILLGKDTLQLYVGETRQVPVTFSPSNYSLDSIKWKSSDTTVISITTTGVLTAKKVGSSIVTVSNLTNTISLNCLITVVPAPVAIDSLKIGLIAYYPFNNSAADLSGNNFNGTVYGATPTTDRNGNVNSAYYFDGISNNIIVKDSYALRLSNTDFTINNWVYIDRYDASYGSIILDKRGNGSQNGWDYGIAGYGDLTNRVGAYGVITFIVSAGNDSVAIGKTKVDTTKWHMVTTSYSVSKKEVRIYVDGQFDTATENMPSPNGNTTADMYIGSDNLNVLNAYFLKGKIDDIRIYNRQLSSAEIQKLFLITN